MFRLAILFSILQNGSVCDVTLISFINNYTSTGIDLGDTALTVSGSNFVNLSTPRLAFYQRYIATFVANNSADSEMLSATISKLVSTSIYLWKFHSLFSY